MTHSLVPQILELAAPIAQSLNLEVVEVVFHTNQNPPILRVYVRNLVQDTGLADCEQMSQALEECLDTAGIIPDAYILEVSSPGISQVLTTDREFTSFKGFPVRVMASEPVGNRQEWVGQLIRRDDAAVHLSLKGRAIAIPRQVVTRVELTEE